MKPTLALLLPLLFLAACSPEPFEEPSGSYDLAAGIEGNWALENVAVEDRSFPSFSTQSFNDYFRANPLSISFNTEDQTYQVEGNDYGHPFGSGGSYQLDDPEYPTRMTCYSAADTTQLELGNMVRAIDQQMVLNRVGASCDEVYAQYSYRFQRIQN